MDRRITDVSGPNPLKTLGLKTGDLVTQLNDKPIAPMLDDPSALMALVQGDVVVVKLVRGSIVRHHRYDLVP